MEQSKYLTFFKRRVEPFIALGVLVLLIILSVQLMEGNELREEISQSCGWEEEDFRCFCEKSKVSEIMNNLDNDFEFKLGEEEYVQVDR